MPSQRSHETAGAGLGLDVLAAALEAVEQPVCVVDPSSAIRFANRAAVAALGYSDAAELLGRSRHETIHHHHPDGRPFPASECPMLRSSTTGETVTRDLDCFFRRDGSMFRVSYVSAPLGLTDGPGAVVAFTDIEERWRADRAVGDGEARPGDEQAALRRVATLAARGTGPEPVFRTVAGAARTLLDCDTAAVVRFEADGTVTTMGSSGARQPAGVRLEADPGSILASVRATGRTARSGPDDPMAPHMPGAVGGEGGRAALASPIVVDGELWGAMTVGRTGDAVLPPETETRLETFTELIATVVGSTESRAALRRLAEEQAALQRVATLVARGVEPAELFAAVSREVGRMFGSDLAAVARWDPDGPSQIIVGLIRPMAGWDVGSRMPLAETTAAAAVYRTGRSARTDAPSPFNVAVREMKVVSGVASPVVVDGRPWGAITVASREPLPPDAEQRLEKFTELVATAVANAASRQALRRIADEQAALRRVATLVAEGAPPSTVFDAVAAEMLGLLQTDGLSVCRYEQDGEFTIVAHRGTQAQQLRPGRRIRHDDPDTITATVRRTGRPARVDSYALAEGPNNELLGHLRYRSGVGVPIIVDGRLWGVTVASWASEHPPSDTERRMAQFGGLLDSAIANADSRDQLTASRARLLTAADDARRRVVRDLHDGAQQRLVHAIVTLKLARDALRQNGGDLASLLDEALDHAERGNAELRELAHGIHPGALTIGGLRGAVGTFLERLDLPVDVDVIGERLPPEIEASAYFVVAEALTNVVKHSQAAHAEVTASVRDGMLDVRIRDDGIGGADPAGHGLVGMKDRVAALGGRLEIASAAGRGTCVAATLPLPRRAPQGLTGAGTRRPRH
jgi:PAS domain S-box-containing protein